jgi:hypothetical protein
MPGRSERIWGRFVKNGRGKLVVLADFAEDGYRVSRSMSYGFEPKTTIRAIRDKFIELGVLKNAEVRTTIVVDHMMHTIVPNLDFTAHYFEGKREPDGSFHLRFDPVVPEQEGQILVSVAHLWDSTSCGRVAQPFFIGVDRGEKGESLANRIWKITEVPDKRGCGSQTLIFLPSNIAPSVGKDPYLKDADVVETAMVAADRHKAGATLYIRSTDKAPVVVAAAAAAAQRAPPRQPALKIHN